MNKKAIILDLDNTIYPVSAIGDKLFEKLFHLIKESNTYSGNIELIQKEIMRRPFQLVAKEFGFSEKLLEDCIFLLNNLSYEESMKTFEGYEAIRKFSCKKFLVTTGFTKLQKSKIKQLGIEQDFEDIFIVDPGKSNLTKKDIFKKILDEWNYKPTDVIVIGDDIESEIKAARELGIETILYDFRNQYQQNTQQKIIRNFWELEHHFDA